MFNRLNRQVDIQLRPIKMTWTRKFNLYQFTNTSIFEPWKLFEWNKLLVLTNQQPETVARNVSDLHRQSGCSKPAGCHFMLLNQLQRQLYIACFQTVILSQ